MALVMSEMVPLGTRKPIFAATDVRSNTLVSSETLASDRPLLVMFISKHCPYVVHVQQELARIGRDYADGRISIVSISSNDTAEYPEDSPSELRTMAEDLGFSFPVCYDESQEIAKSFHAT